MYISFITDEATQKPKEFIRLAKKYEIESLELRTVENRKVCEMSKAEILELKKQLDDEGITVCCISSFVFKSDIEEEWQSQFDILKHALENAEYMGVSVLRIFSFIRREVNRKDYHSQIVDALNQAAEIARPHNKKLAIENCRKTMHSSGAELGALFEDLSDCETIRVLWDPANSMMCGLDTQPEVNGYYKVAPYVSHVHIKDPRIFDNGNRAYVPLGEGQFNLEGQIRELKKNNYDQCLSLETHWRKNRIMSFKDFDFPGGDSFSKSGYEATDKDLSLLQESLMKVQQS